MATDAVSNSAVIDGTSSIRQAPTNAGWIGSKAADKGDFCTVDASGYIDQAAAAANQVGGSTKVGLIPHAILSSVLIDTAASKAIEFRRILEETLIELQVVNGSNTRIDATNAMVGDSEGIRRCTNGDYAMDVSGSAHLEVVAINKDNNTVICRVKPGLRLA